MKKFVSLSMALCMCLLMFVGCGAKEVNLSDVMGKINSEYSLSLKEIKDVDELSKYYAINADDVKQFAAEIDSNTNAPVEIVLVEAKDSSSADTVEKALNARYNSIHSQYASYSADKLEMVNKCKVTKDGNFVSLIVADKATDMLDLYYKEIK